jgi:hypothetical protein
MDCFFSFFHFRGDFFKLKTFSFMKKINLLIVALFFAFAAFAQTTSTFDTLVLGTNTYWTGSNLSGGFYDGNAYFENQYDTSSGGYWAGGFVYSDATDTTGGYLNPATAITQSGFAGSANYAVAYDEGYGNVKLITSGAAAGKMLQGFYVTNTSYAYYSMKYGDSYEHAFTSDSADFLLLHISGWKGGNPVADTVNFYLANFLVDTVPGTLVNTWQYVSLISIGDADSLIFWLTGSQNGQFGLNTPAYFAMDNFVTADIGFIQDTMAYTQDTLINVLSSFPDTLTGGPFTVTVISTVIPGASAAVDSGNVIFYIPQQGVVGWDTVTYEICNASNQCDTAQIIFDIEPPTGIHSINTLQAKVYPNPCTNSFSVYHSADVKTINLYDMEGRLMREIPCTTGELITGINANELSAGVYMVKVMSDNAVGVTKIIKQ